MYSWVTSNRGIRNILAHFHSVRNSKIKTLKTLSVLFIVPLAGYTVSTETKEERIMKKHSIRNTNHGVYRYYRRPYPNAAEPGYFIDKLVDGILAVVTAMGCITFFFFLVTM
jgi:hypothetical protein